MNILKQQKGTGALELLTIFCVLFPIGFYATHAYEIRARKVVVRFVEGNSFVDVVDKVDSVDKVDAVEGVEGVTVFDQYLIPQRFESSQDVIRKVNENAHVKPFVGKKGNKVGYKGACMRYPFSSKVFHVDVKYPAATYFSLPVGVSILSASFIADTAATGFSSNLLNGKKIISGSPPNEQEHIIIQPVGLDTPDAQILVFTTAGALNIMLHVKKKPQYEPMYCVEWVLPPKPAKKKQKTRLFVDSNYEINGNWDGWQYCSWMPEVWNDGRQTYIKYKNTMGEHPVLFGLYKTSFLNILRKTQIKNSYDSVNLTQIVDGIPDEFVLAMGKKELTIRHVNIEVSQNENKSKR